MQVPAVPEAQANQKNRRMKAKPHLLRLHAAVPAEPADIKIEIKILWIKLILYF